MGRRLSRRAGRGRRQGQIRGGNVWPADEGDHKQNDVARYEPEGPEAEQLDPPQAAARGVDKDRSTPRSGPWLFGHFIKGHHRASILGGPGAYSKRRDLRPGRCLVL
jgi:hypothetical protein